MIKKAVVLCGGLGTRFLPISKSVPKEMLPVLDKPIMQIVVEQLKEAGIEDVLLVVGRNKESIINHFDRHVELERRLEHTNKPEYLDKIQKLNGMVNLYTIRQLEPKGTAMAVKMARSFVGDNPFVLMFGDEVLYGKEQNAIEQLISNFDKHHKTVIATQTVPMSEVYKYGIISFDHEEDGAYFVNNVVEKPKIEDAPSNVSYIGPAIITKDIFSALDKMEEVDNKELVITDAFNILAHENNLMAQNIQGDRFDIGNKLGLMKVNVFAALHDSDISEDAKHYIKEIAKNL